MAASVVQAARQQLRGEWSEWAPVWRRPSRGPGSRSQSADPPALAPIGRDEKCESSELWHQRRLLRQRSRSLSEISSGRSSQGEQELPYASLPQCDNADCLVDPLDSSDELHEVEQELEEKQHFLLEVKANGQALEEKLQETEKNARHFRETVLALEESLEAQVQEGEPHLELRSTTQDIPCHLENLVDEWARARAALGLGW